MKLFLVLLVIFISSAYGFYTAPGEVTADVFDEALDDETISRISNGKPLKKGEFLSFCYISVQFNNKFQTCGCVVRRGKWVITSARCVQDCSEDQAWNVTVTLPQKKGKDAVIAVEKIFIPDGMVGELPAYDPTKEVPATKFSESNIAYLKLAKEIKFDGGKTVDTPSVFGPDTIADAFTALSTTYKDAYLVSCGIGIIDNKRSKPKGILCTNVTAINPADDGCKSRETGMAFEEIPADVVCLQQTDDSNICPQDFGGPIYVRFPGTDGKWETRLFGWSIGSPDIKRNAPCLAGHTVFVTYYTSIMISWVNTVRNMEDPSSKTLTDIKTD